MADVGCSVNGQVEIDALFIIESIYISAGILVVMLFFGKRKTDIRKRFSSAVHAHRKEPALTKANHAGLAMNRIIFQKNHNNDYELKDNRGKKKKGDRQSWETDPKKIKFTKKVGAGNFGEVWMGTWMKNTVAIKTVVRGMAKNQEFISKFKEEIHLMSSMNHPNIVMFLGASIEAPSICLILEYCVHGNLIEFLKSAETNGINISMHLLLKMALDIARGIKYLHDKMRIIQRDLKGRNVLVDADLNCKIADFGLSRIKSQEDDAGMTACGTPAWTAPEVVRMEDYTEKVDVYSFGIVMWELLMSDEPYDGEGGLQIAYAAAEQGLRPEIPDFAPDRYAELMVECWADNPEERPHFGDILERLFQMMKDESNPFVHAEFYFGSRDFEHVESKFGHLLDDKTLNRELFEEDFSAIVKRRKFGQKSEIFQRHVSSNRLSIHRKSNTIGGLSGLKLNAPEIETIILPQLETK